MSRRACLSESRNQHTIGEGFLSWFLTMGFAMRFLLCSFLLVLAVVGCKKSQPAASHVEHPSFDVQKGHMPSMNGKPGVALEPGEVRHLGKEVPEDEQPLSKAELLDTCVDPDERCLVAARVGASCTHSGCWFTLVGDEASDLVLVEMKDEAFTMPINAAGSDIVALGTLQKQDFTKAQSFYFLKENAREHGLDEPKKEDAPTEGYLFTVEGVVLKRSASAELYKPADHGHMDHGHMDHGEMDHGEMDHRHMGH